MGGGGRTFFMVGLEAMLLTLAFTFSSMSALKPVKPHEHARKNLRRRKRRTWVVEFRCGDVCLVPVLVPHIYNCFPTNRMMSNHLDARERQLGHTE